MEHYIVSARKYRPSTFASVIGQRPISAALKHAMATNRLAHAYLFCGSRGVGKTSCARIFAKTINCEHRTPDGEACNECESCKAFNAGNSLNIIELDAASHNGIDDMKALIEQVQVPPTQGRYRVFIIDEVHMLSAAAFNAFLKTLEEPPEYVIFILATTEKHKIIPTILSRCQIYDFSRITIQDMVEHLQSVAQQEGISAEPTALGVIARKADGAMRDALSIFDQVAAATFGNITYQQTIDNLNILDSAYYSRIVDCMLTGNVPEALLIYKEVRDKGFDSQFFINGLALYLRDLMLAMTPSTLPLIEASEDEKKMMAAQAQKCAPQMIYRAMDLCNDADLNYRIAANKQFLVELTLVKLCGAVAPVAPAAPGAAMPRVAPAAQGAPAVRDAAKAAEPAQPAQISQSHSQSHSHSQSQSQSHSHSQSQSQKKPVISFSIKGVRKEKAPEEDKPQAEDPVIIEDKPYELAQLHALWAKFAQEHPTERILANTMLGSMPQKGDGDTYLVAVDDAIQVEKLNEFKHEILTALRTGLSNSRVDFEARVQQQESSPTLWTQREVLQHMAEEHPALKGMIDEFGLTL